MGNGSPRLLRHLLVRSAACLLAMLVFAPPASADVGAVSLAGAAVPDPANPSVGVKPQLAVQAAAAVPVATVGAVATPVKAPAPDRTATAVTTPRIPLAKTLPATLATHVAKASSVERRLISGRPTPQQRPRRAAGAHAASPSRHPTTTPQSAAGGIAASARVATFPTTDIRAIHPTRQVQPGAHPAGTDRAPLPLPPAPLPLAGGAGGGVSSAGIALLLFALLAEAAALVPPGLRRRIALALAAPRPYPYLLRLEHPD
jgi:hypothetical protein